MKRFFRFCFVIAQLLRTVRMCCDTKNIICQELMLFSALTSPRVLASGGICHSMTTAGRQIPLACDRAGEQTARSRGHERLWPSCLLTAPIYF